MHASKLRQVTDFTIVSCNAKHYVDQNMVLFCYYSLGGNTAIPGWLHARLCHAFLVATKMLETSLFSSPRLVGRRSVAVVLPVCPFVVSFSKFREFDTHDLLRTC